MRYRLSLICSVVLAGAVVPGPAAARAQGKANVPRIEERLFLLYALENMSLQDVTYTTSPGCPPEPFSRVLARFQARQRLLYDTMRRHVQKRKNEDLLEVFRQYEKELDLLTEFQQALDKRCAEHERKLYAAQAAASSRVLLTGLGYALVAASRGADDETTFLRGMTAAAAAAIRERQRLRDFNAEAARQLTTSFDALDRDYTPRRWEAHKQFRQQFEAYIATNKFEDAEFAFRTAGSQEAPTRNPFLMVAAARMVLYKKDATVKEMLEQAEVCRRASAMVPADRAFNIYRAMFLAVAGLLANRAATKDIGATGFPLIVKDVPEAGKVAARIWTAYVRLEPFDTSYTDEVVQAYIIACAQACDARTGYAAILKTSVTLDFRRHPHPRPLASDRPDYWYDCARVCSTAGNVQLSLECLQHALRLGFRDKETAKLSPDLRNVRENTATRDQFKRLFP
jgi:hypothetical protein